MNQVGGSGASRAGEGPLKTGSKQKPVRAARTGDRTGQRPAPERAQPAAPKLWDVAGVAVYLQLPIGSIYKMTARSAAVRIPHIRLGGKLRFRQSDIDRWLTLLTVSNLDTLAKARKTVERLGHGNDSQAETQ